MLQELEPSLPVARRFASSDLKIARILILVLRAMFESERLKTTARSLTLGDKQSDHLRHVSSWIHLLDYCNDNTAGQFVREADCSVHESTGFLIRKKYLLLTEFEVPTVSYGPSVFPLIYGPSAKCAGHKSTGKNEDPYLQYGPRKRG